MTSIPRILGPLSVVLCLSACATANPAGDSAVKQECQCKCAYASLQGGVTPAERIGTFTFASDGPTCAFTAIDRYVPCQDNQGQTHAGTRYFECQFMGVSPPVP